MEINQKTTNDQLCRIASHMRRMTPQATRAPELPVVLLVGAFPRPKSSGSAWITMARPTTLCGPVRDITVSVMLITVSPLV